MDSWEISVRLPARLAEAASDALAELGEGGVSIELPFAQDSPDDKPVALPDAIATVCAYTPARAAAAERDRLRRRANRLLNPLGVRARLRRVRDRDWIEACKASFPPQRIGRRLLILPPWSDEAARPDDVVVVIEPGMAFGTGDHPTTRACLAAAERLVRPNSRVLDLGCGSGILSLAALKLGADSVWALDIDPFAVDATLANLARNERAGSLQVRLGSLGSAVPPDLPHPFDMVLANIASAPLIELAGAIAGALAPGGSVVASGIIAERAGDVATAFEVAGLGVVETMADGEWRTLVAVRDGG